MRLTCWMPVMLALTSGAVLAQDQVNIDPATIRGNSELPKVLYIVPWKSPAKSEVTGRPLSSLIDEVLIPIDRDVLRRQMQYQAQRQAAKGESTAK